MTQESESADAVDHGRFLYSRLVVAALCVLFADYLFYDRVVGLSFAVFIFFLASVIVFVNSLTDDPRRFCAALGALVAGLAPGVEHPNLLSFAFGVLSLAIFALLALDVGIVDWRRQLLRAAFMPLAGPQLLRADVSRSFDAGRIGGARAFILRAAKGWAAPIGLVSVFLLLFAEANPLIEDVLVALDPVRIWRVVDFMRMSFWALTLLLLWPIFHMRDGLRASTGGRVARAPIDLNADEFLGARAIINALLLSNALFAAQTALDIVYLWGGVALPNGMTYASYAHRGAYPLVATALIAGAFALVAMRSGGPAETSPLIRLLTMVFVAQNVMLTISSMLRLDLYVEAYSLSLLRLAAFVWMGLVATGLVLMMIMMLRGKPLSWLVHANALSLIVTLYVACFVNAPYVVAAFNVQRSREIAGVGPDFDADYTMSLGPEAAPAVDDYLRRRVAAADDYRVRELREWRRELARSAPNADWRAFSFRAWRLQQYLASEESAVDVPQDRH